MASIDGHYRGPLSAEDAATIAAQLGEGRPPRELLPEKSYEGDYARRLGARERAAKAGDSEERE